MLLIERISIRDKQGKASFRVQSRSSGLVMKVF